MSESNNNLPDPLTPEQREELRKQIPPSALVREWMRETDGDAVADQWYDDLLAEDMF